jgi:hypothetical protein
LDLSFHFLELAVILSLFFNAEELEMILFWDFVASFMSDIGTVTSSSSKKN